MNPSVDTESVRTHSQALPKRKDDIISLVKHVLGLSRVSEIRIRPDEFYVARVVEGEGPVVPKDVPEVDAEFVLSRIQLEMLNTWEHGHPYFMLMRCTQRIADRGLTWSGIVVPDDSVVVDYFGLPEDRPIPDTFMGVRVLRADPQQYQDKIVLLGGPTHYSADAVLGIVFDMGV